MSAKTKSRPVLKFRKPSEETVALLTQTTAPMPGVTSRNMFGCLCVFVNGNMLAGVFEESIFVRLDSDERAKLAKTGAQPFEPIPGRPMREYMVVTPATMQSKTRLNAWLEKAYAYAASLPPKASKKK